MSDLNERVDRAIAFIEEHRDPAATGHSRRWVLDRVYLILAGGTRGPEDEGTVP